MNGAAMNVKAVVDDASRTARDFVVLGGHKIPIIGEIGDGQVIKLYGRCQFCGCTDADCQGCIDRTGEACSWANAERTVCTACAHSVFKQALAGEEACPQ